MLENYRYLRSMMRLQWFIICLFFSLSASAQMRWNALYQSYIDEYKDLAIEQMLRYHVPASITLAQGIFESGAGRSELTLKGNNHFGIKCHGWTGATTYHDDDERQECFRAYRNARESYEDHSKFLANGQRYRRLFSLKQTDYKGWAHGLKECGYATNPRYAYKLIELIELYKLYVFDKATSYDHFIADHSSKDKHVAGQPLHPIKIYNKNYYMYAREGDTFKSIAEETGLSASTLAKNNERDKHDRLRAGDIIYLKKKQKRAEKRFKNVPHIVKPGQSMYDIAQIYGIRLKNLYKMNNLTTDYTIKVGDKLRVY